MAIRLYNSLTRQVEEFVPRDNAKVQMFVCGPTVYDYVHLGNARTFTVFDVIAKWLRYRGFEVTYLQNITDVDDRIIQKATDSSTPWQKIADTYTTAFLEDMRVLGNDAVSDHARATAYIPQVVAQVKTLIAKGNVYKIENDGWYFDLTTFPEYGKLSGRTAAEADDGVSRIDDSSKKRNTGDFCVWKFSKPGEPVWQDAELGAGRPGWHIEDTAITEAVFGPQYDLHGGGMDLKFPHHEAEIAQQESASGKIPFVKYWMHVGFLQMASEKMSKSKGNITSLRDALGRWSPEALRFFLLSAHYRTPLEFSEQGLDAAEEAIKRINEVNARLVEYPLREVGEFDIQKRLASVYRNIEIAMDEDFNIPQAFGYIFDIIPTINLAIKKRDTLSVAAIDTIKQFLSFIDTQFGIIKDLPPDEIRIKTDQMDEARHKKDYARSDAIRDELKREGYQISTTTIAGITTTTASISPSASPSPSPSPSSEAKDNE